MDWLRKAAAQLREWLMQQAWLDGWQSSIAHTPDWALLAAGSATLLLFALLLRITWPGSRTSDTDTKPQTQKQSRQQASANVAPAPATTKSPPAPAPAGKPVPVQPAASSVPAQMADDDEDNRSVRVFVSSTFLDMQTERDELVTKTFPALRAKYRARGVELFEVDLRWGITRDQQERGETLPTLLAEIDRCRPYFIGLIGDRYGWVPPAAALTDKLKADYPVLADADGASVTAMEIMHGVLSNPDTAARACFFERDPNWDWRATLNDTDHASASDEPEAARTKLADLKAWIGQKARIETYARPEEIGPKVAAALDALLEARFPEADAPDAFEQTARLHRAYARDRRGLHVGAKDYVDDLNRWMETKDAAPLLVTGASGGGKSTLVANWIHAWRKAHPSDIVFEHYLGASPDSADPLLIMQRLWEQLNRATGETVALPGHNAKLTDMSAALAQRLAQARLSAGRSGARVLIALDGLDKLSSEQNLRWLPIAPGVHWLASSLHCEAQTAALARGFAPRDVKPLTEQERRDFIAGTLARWRRKLEPQHIARILQPAAVELAGSPLYLKTVLEELRVSADNARLAERLDDYRSARDMPGLFDRVLARLEGDCEPGLAAKALPLIWASRTGLEETEILAITNATPLAWAKLRNGLGDSLRDQAGRVAFSHDYLSQAVAARYLATGDTRRGAHLAIADQFEKREPDERQAEELPYQLEKAEAWDRLEALLVDLKRFQLLHARGDGELWGYWLPLKERGRDPEALLCGAFETRAGEADRWSESDASMAFELGDFLQFAGAVGVTARRMAENCVAASERIRGERNHNTLFAFRALAELLRARGELAQARQVQEKSLKYCERSWGADHPFTLDQKTTLALVLHDLGDLPAAMALQEETVQACSQQLGPEHLKTLTGLGNLAAFLGAAGDHVRARDIESRVLETSIRLLGPEHMDSLAAMNNLAETLRALGEGKAAQAMLERVLEVQRRQLGLEHERSLKTANNLASALADQRELGRAEKITREALTSSKRALGDDHPVTVVSMNNLAAVVKAQGNLGEARLLQTEAMERQLKAMGPDHPTSITLMNNLASTMFDLGDVREAFEMQERVVAASEKSLGPDHPSTHISKDNLAGYRAALRGH